MRNTRVCPLRENSLRVALGEGYNAASSKLHEILLANKEYGGRAGSVVLGAMGLHVAAWGCPRGHCGLLRPVGNGSRCISDYVLMSH